MLEFLKEMEHEEFKWSSLGNIAEGRESLGEEMPVYVYRMFQYTIKDEIVRQYGKAKAIEIFQNAGKASGLEFAENMLDLSLDLEAFIANIQEVLLASKIGLFRMEEFDPETGRAILTVGEDLDCSALPVTGETVCNFDEGFLAGIMNRYTKKDYVVTEIDCWATGSRVCRFEAIVK